MHLESSKNDTIPVDITARCARVLSDHGYSAVWRGRDLFLRRAEGSGVVDH